MIPCHFLRFFGFLALLAALLSASPALARSFTVNGVSSGTLDNYSAKLDLTVDPADKGKTGVVYVAAWIEGSWTFLDANGAWQAWTGGALPVYQQGTLGTHSIAVFRNADARPAKGALFYVAYGYDEADMKANGTFQKGLTVGSDVAGVMMDGTVYAKDSSTPLAGVTITSSLGGNSALTDANGRFTLKTGVTPGSGTTYTLTLTASGYQTLTLNKDWGSQPNGLTFYLAKASSTGTGTSANPLYGQWKLTNTSNSKVTFLGQSLAFVDNNVMTGSDGDCTYLASYLTSGEVLTALVLLNLPDANACPGNPAGTSRGATFKVVGDLLTMTSLGGNSYTFTRAGTNLTAAGSWTRIYSSDPQGAQLAASFVMDDAGNVTDTVGSCVAKMFVQSTPSADNPLILNWSLTGKGDNGQCVRSIPMGQTEVGNAMVIGSVLYMWSASEVRVYRRTL